ncbi:MAG: urea carboxylase-associated family protein [Pseudomonadota bacterium]
MSERQTIPAGHGLALRLAAGEAVVVINTAGTQVVDTWAFRADLSAAMSMPISRVENGRLHPLIGEPFFDDEREPILIYEADTSPGVHDTIMAACDPARYRRLGAPPEHRSCVQNLLSSMAEIGAPIPQAPQPLNLFMNIPIHADGSLEQGVPLGAPMDQVTLRAVVDCIVAVSACPQDMTPINNGIIHDAHIVHLASGADP